MKGQDAASLSTSFVDMRVSFDANRPPAGGVPDAVVTGLELITENWPNPLGLAEYVPMLKKRLYLKGKCSGTSLSSSPPYPSSKKKLDQLF